MKRADLQKWRLTFVCSTVSGVSHKKSEPGSIYGTQLVICQPYSIGWKKIVTWQTAEFFLCQPQTTA